MIWKANVCDERLQRGDEGEGVTQAFDAVNNRVCKTRGAGLRQISQLFQKVKKKVIYDCHSLLVEM